MKALFLIILTATGYFCKSQVIIHPPLPNSGMTLKNQLWNLLVVNSSTATKKIHIEIKIGEAPSNILVMSGQTVMFSIPPGNKQLQVNSVSPVQYNSLHPAYSAFVNSDFLPVGTFLVCYNLFEHVGDAVSKIGEECGILEIQPLSPPQLISPFDKTSIESALPNFNWLAPSPLNMFANLNYDLTLVEVNPNQSPADAVQVNIPLHNAYQLYSLQYPYPASAPALQTNKTYAWRVTAKNSQSPVAYSETWEFKLGQFNQGDSLLKSELPYVKLSKEDQAGYSLFIGSMKFEYYNETSDTIWNAAIYDLSANRRKAASLFDSIALKPGANMVKMALKDNGDFQDRHLYLLEVKNSREETWRLRFEYRKPQE